MRYNYWRIEILQMKTRKDSLVWFSKTPLIKTSFYEQLKYFFFTTISIIPKISIIAVIFSLLFNVCFVWNTFYHEKFPMNWNENLQSKTFFRHPTLYICIIYSLRKCAMLIQNQMGEYSAIWNVITNNEIVPQRRE